MDFVKRNWLLIVVTVVLLTATVVLSLMYRKASAATKEANARFLEVIETEIRINTYDVGPTESNVLKAEENIGAAENELSALAAKVAEVFSPLGIQDLNGFEVKNELVAAYKEMDLALSEGGVSNAVPSYGFQEFDNRIPNSEERKLVLRQLRVVQGILGVVAESDLVSVKAIVRPPDLPLLQHALYEYYTFRLSVSGDIESIRKLLNGLHQTALCLVVRNVTFAIEPAPMSTFGFGAPLVEQRPAPRARNAPPSEGFGDELDLAVEPDLVENPDEGLAKLGDDVCTEHRIVWREPAYLEVTIELDYVEFRQPKED
jgi:hypothetical protein